MPSKSRIAALALGLALLAPTIPTARAADDAGSPPARKMEKNSAKECAVCHISWIDVFFFDGKPTELTDRPPLEAASSEEMCFSCHNGSLGDSRERVWGHRRHPTNIKPPAGYVIPKELPLDGEGKIVCATCHSAHSISDATRFDQVIFLRLANKNSELCFLCHKDRIGGSRLGNHPLLVRVDEAVRKKVEKLGGRFNENGAIICESCHVAHGAGAEHNLIMPTEGDDGASILCELCHGSSPARSEHKGGQISHPVNKAPALVKIPAAWSGGVKVQLGAGGKVTCETCHRTHNAARNTRLLVRPGGEAFCLECHGNMARVVGTNHDMNVAGFDGPNALGEDVKQSGVCGACHLVHEAVGEKLWARALPAVEGVDATSRLCLSCHRPGGAAAEKPVSVPLHSVGRPAPAGMEVGGLPLYRPDGAGEGNVFSCATCHDVHQWDPADAARRPGKKTPGSPATSFLRFPDTADSSLCLRCHKEKELIRKTRHDSSMVPALARAATSSLCGSCHAVHAGQGSLLWAYDVPPGKDLDRVSSLCLSCHRAGGSGEQKAMTLKGHPLGPAPKGFVSTALPLYGPDGDRAGRIVSCATCHDVHRWDPLKAENRPGKKGQGDATTSFLRAPNSADAALCLGCHQEQETVRGTEHDPAVSQQLAKGSGPANVCGSCHAVHAARGELMWPEELPAAGETDRASLLCLSCHRKGGTAGEKPMDLNGHPLVKDVPTRFDTGPLPLFTTEGHAGGRTLSCATCHDVHRWDSQKAANRPGKKVDGDSTTSFLRAPDSAGSALCLTCHREKETVRNTAHDRALSPEIGKGTTANNVCGGCHAVHGARGDLMWGRERAAAEPGDPFSGLCLSCHREGGAAKERTLGPATHFSGQALPEKISAGDLPLAGLAGSAGGRMMTCATCHDVHRWDPVRSENRPSGKARGDASTSFLRKPYAQDAPLCATCHPTMAGMGGTAHDLRRAALQAGGAAEAGRKEMTVGVCSSCHGIHHAQQARRLWAFNPVAAPLPDPLWPYCLNCHAREAGTGAKGIDQPIHPVGVAWRGAQLGLPLADSPGGPDEKLISCITCHDTHGGRLVKDGRAAGPESAEPGGGALLRLPVSGPATLCSRCHPGKEAISGTPHDGQRMDEFLGPPTPNERRLGSCARCHAVHGPAAKAWLWATKSGEGDDRMMRLCTGCHRDEKVTGGKEPFFPVHPRNTFISNQSLKVKGGDTDFPLYDEEGKLGNSGLITCTTCHNPHRWDAADPELKPETGEKGNAVNSFLRNKGATFGFCSDCHSFRAILFYKNFHDPREWKRKGR